MCTDRKLVRYVPWAGKRGMLPHQRYRGVLGQIEYDNWLKMPLDVSDVAPAANAEGYFSTAPSTAQRIEPPPVQTKHLKPIYVDDHIIVVNKPSGVLSVPGPRRHECVASLVYRYFGKGHAHPRDAGISEQAEENEPWQPLTTGDNKEVDTMIVHRLDRDTSGVLMFARNDDALKRLHLDFKDKMRKRVSKRYVALVCGHWNQNGGMGGMVADEGEIDLPLVRDIDRPPFMCIATAETELRQQKVKEQPRSNTEGKRRQHAGFLRMVGKGAKPSLTEYRILSYEYLVDETGVLEDAPRLLPVTRVELTPITGRTHQLRVHCAASGHPIVGDSIYGRHGEGSPRGGLILEEPGGGASLDVQERISEYWTRRLQRNSDAKDEECMLCLHACQLSIFHPFTESPMLFECPPPF
ncbi:hypothetical protein ACHAXT_003303 [Thalassiosira profunda]